MVFILTSLLEKSIHCVLCAYFVPSVFKEGDTYIDLFCVGIAL
jgi:hypothetical protein